MDVVQAQSVLELSQNNEDVLRRQLQATRDRFEVGEVTRTDVSQAEARLSEATANRINAEGQLQIARATFERVAGFKPGFLSKPITLPPLPPSLEETVGIALEKNPAVLSADYLYKAAGDDIDTSIADILPDVSIEAVSSRRSGSGVLGTNEIDSDQVLVNVTVPIYQAGAEYSNVRQAKVLWQQRKFESMDTENLIREASIQAWEQYQTSIATISANEDAIRAAEVALEGVRQEQQYGARTVLDILDAEQELFEARVNLVVSERNRIVSAYTLLVAVGAMNAKDLQLDTPIYDPKEHYNEVEYQLIGF
jgi:outer membrane protein